MECPKVFTKIQIVTKQALSLFCINALSAFQNLARLAYMLLKLFGDILRESSLILYPQVSQSLLE